MKNSLKVLCGAVTLAMSGQVLADVTWVLSPTESTVVSAGGIGESTTAWANTTGSGVNGSSADGYAIAAQTGQMTLYSGGGIGVNNLARCATSTQVNNCDTNEGVAPEHAIDNNERYEMLKLSFGSSVKLTKATIGYAQPDSDMTVLAYTGIGSSNITGMTWAAVKLSSSWQVIGNYGTSAQTPDPFGTLVNVALNTTYSSTAWLIGAYNPLAGGTTSGLTLGDDSIKLLSVDGVAGTTTQQVPEPGSLALFGLAFAGMAALRRRQRV